MVKMVIHTLMLQQEMCIKKRDGAWGKIGNIRGPQGEQGQKGDKGENGKDGRAPKIKVEDITKSAESAGVSSRSGIQITVYDDKNNNDVFDEGDTILNTKDVYNGTDGKKRCRWTNTKSQSRTR